MSNQSLAASCCLLKEEEAHHPFSSFPFQNVLSVSNQSLTAQCSLLNYLSSWVHAFMGWMDILIT